MKTKLLLALFFAINLPVIAFAQWGTPVNLSPNSIAATQNESMGSCIGVNGSTVHIVWTDQRSTTKTVIYYTRSLDAGLTWSNPIAITDTNGSAWNPTIAVNGSNIHLVWRNIVNNTRSSYYKRSLDGGNTWGTAIRLDSAVADWPAVTVSGNNVYVANDIVTASSPYNTEIFFLKSTDNGATWSKHQQITFSVGRSEDEAITAQGNDVFMSWNDNRNGTMQIFYKHSGDNGVTWGPDVLINSEPSYGTMVSANGSNIDVPSAGAPSGKYQIHLDQSANTGATWGTDKNLTNDPANTYYYPYMIRSGSNLHLTYIKASSAGVAGQYIHSTDGGATWSAPLSLGNAGITPFDAVSGCVVHIVWDNAGKIYYMRNPTGNCTSSSPVSVTVAPAGPLTICSAVNTVLTATASPVSGYLYQWKNGVQNISGATNSTYTAAAAGSYSVVITASNLSSASSNTVSVSTLPSAISASQNSVCSGSCASLSVLASPGLAYNHINNIHAYIGPPSAGELLDMLSGFPLYRR